MDRFLGRKSIWYRMEVRPVWSCYLVQSISLIELCASIGTLLITAKNIESIQVGCFWVVTILSDDNDFNASQFGIWPFLFNDLPLDWLFVYLVLRSECIKQCLISFQFEFITLGLTKWKKLQVLLDQYFCWNFAQDFRFIWLATRNPSRAQNFVSLFR